MLGLQSLACSCRASSSGARAAGKVEGIKESSINDVLKFFRDYRPIMSALGTDLQQHRIHVTSLTMSAISHFSADAIDDRSCGLK